MILQPPFTRTLRRGFTLVELLVVIVIIAILASLAVPVTNKVMENANKVRIKAVMKDLQVAIGHYRTEYNRFPVTLTGGSDTDIEPVLTDGNNPIINILMALVDPAESPNMNSRAIKFIDLPFARNGSFGIVDPSGGTGTGAPVSLRDIWSQPYVILLDTNYDNRIENPDSGNVDLIISSQAPQYLNTSTAIYSLGKDKVKQTKDDITSWR